LVGSIGVIYLLPVLEQLLPKVREIATGEIMTAPKGIGQGLVDEIGDFKDALEAAAEAGG